jgi:citrate lyase subunit beta/citryl-CoA lyase
VYFGAEDFITDIGGVRTESNNEVLYARSRVVIAASLSGIPALDQVVVDFGDDERFRTEANEARSLGFQGKLCIHPSQVQLAREAFTPSDEEITRARALLAAAADAEVRGLGVISFEGTMVDAPIIMRARKILDLIED